MSRPAQEFLDLPASSKISLHVRNGQFDQQQGDEPLAGWRTCPELPLPKELMVTDPPPLLVNRIDKPPKSKEEYLETHHRLYRCEGVEPLRQAIAEFRDSPKMMEGDKAFIYTQVHIKGYLFTTLGASCRIAFSTERSPTKVYWRQSDRLKPGTLVVLSPRSDAFQTQCIVATIASRPLIGGLEPDVEAGESEHIPPRVDISWADNNSAPIDPTTEMVMLEAKSGYFESVRFAMLGLQHAALYQSKLEKYILGAPSEIRHAKYLKELPDQTAVVPDAASHFDPSQLEAFKAMTSRELAIVQGPPGTGKTFTSIVAIQSCVETLRRCEGEQTPIIIAAQTNHALDQLLELCLQREVGKFVRLGGRSGSEAVEQYSMFNVRQRSKARQGNSRAEASREKISSRIQECFNTCFQDLVSAEELHSRGLITLEQFESLTDNEWETADADPDDTFGSIVAWLEDCLQEEPAFVYRPPEGQHVDEDKEEALANHQDDAADDEDKYKLNGLFIPIEPKRTGFIPSSLRNNGAWRVRAETYLATYSDLYKIRPADRGIVYRYLRSGMMDQIAAEIRKLFIEYNEVCDALKVSRWGNYLRVVQYEGIQIVGCTTTGLAKYRGLLTAMMPRVMLIEEAAETREANITCAIFPSLEQLVLVGDHQQLTPHVDVRHLGAPPYNLNVSLFERLVKLEIPYTTLRVQRRMIPAIREIVQTFYPVLQDHPTVTQAIHRPPVPGMGGVNLWWFQHQWPESRNNTLSCMNWNEADMIVGFVSYLVQNGLKPSQITILTYYNAQLDLIQRKLRDDSTFLGRMEAEWSVRTVDGFQGEENDVILLSLVRSPTRTYGPAIAGFVEDENRAVVATSRARRGMYIFGNARNVLESSHKSNQTWQKVYSAFGKQTGYQIPVTCKTHGNTTGLKTPDDWSAVSTGGCGKRCGMKCPNGHPCPMPCHAANQEHLNMCRNPCAKVLTCGHPCSVQCRDDCKCENGCSKAPKNVAKMAPLKPKPKPKPGQSKPPTPARRLPNRRRQEVAASEASSQPSKSGLVITPRVATPGE